VAAPICVARIGAAHGVRGAVKLWTFTEDPLAVKAYGPLTTRDGARQFEVTHVREARDHLVATFKGVASREDAERLNGIELYIAREKLPETDDDEYYHADLIGLAAVNAANEPLGRVVAIVQTDGKNAGRIRQRCMQLHLIERKLIGTRHRKATLLDDVKRAGKAAPT